MKLYEISEEYRLALADLSDLDLPKDVVDDTLEGLAGEVQEKALAVGAFVLNVDADIQTLKDHKSKIDERIKALTNRKELESPHGKILVGTMVLQDIVAMASLAIFSSIGTKASLLTSIGDMFWRGALIFFILLVLGRFVLPKIFYYAAQSIELIFLVGLGWLFTGVALIPLGLFLYSFNTLRLYATASLITGIGLSPRWALDASVQGSPLMNLVSSIATS